jgi:hypothetical protein
MARTSTSQAGKPGIGEVYDRPEYPDFVLRVLDEYRQSRLLFIDAFKDATRHDQSQLYDSMIGRAEDFIRRAVAELATEGDSTRERVVRDVLKLQLNKGSMLEREEKIANAVTYLEGWLIKAGFMVAKKREFVVPSNLVIE